MQAEILRLIDDLVSKRGMGLLLISHDLPLVSHFCDRVMVMYMGRVMEELKASELVRAEHPIRRDFSIAFRRSHTPAIGCRFSIVKKAG